jgi:hypothetical protein
MKWLKKLLSDNSDNEPIVIANHICRAVDDRIQIIQGGRKIFPFNHLTVHLHCENEEEKNILESAFNDHGLQSHIQDFLERREVANWKEIRVRIETSIVQLNIRLAGRPPRFEIRYDKVERGLPEATLMVILGIATQKVYTLKALTRIGRTAEVLDRHGRLVRRNDLVFADQDDEVNLSVGRIQSRIEYDEDKLRFVVYDENSRHGTMVEREGQIMTATGQRGILLLDGDILHFGRARCRFKLKSLEGS